MKNNKKHLLELLDEVTSTAPNNRLKTLLEEVRKDLVKNLLQVEVRETNDNNKSIEDDVIETREEILNNLDEVIKNKTALPHKRTSPYEIFKVIVNGTIENEYNHLMEDVEYIDDMEGREELVSRCNEIQHILYDHLLEEFHTLLDELDDKTGYLACLDNRYYFKRGVMAGLNNLKFLGVINNVHLY
ncbi:hypothetical protein [Clostridium sp.]|uniref:hypothetical protein n=1 Tax=Clostridium sp. TaxID=1506 RepID=UPI002FDE140C